MENRDPGFFRNFVNGLQGGQFFYYHDAQGVFLYLSPSVTDVLGYTPAEFEAHYSTYLTDSPINQHVVAHTDGSLRGEQQPPYEVEIFDKDGAVKRLEVLEFPVRDTAGAVTGVQGIARDITRLTSAEARLNWISAAVEQSPVGVMITDAAGRIEYVNPKFCETTGYAAEEALGQNPRLLKSGETPSAVYRELWETISAGRVFVGELCNRRKNGELVWEHVKICPITGPAGTITGYVAIREDLTERKSLLARMVEMERLASMGTLAAGVAHEINNPLAAVIANVDSALEEFDALAAKLEIDLDVRDALRDARDGALRVRDIVRDLKVFSRKEDDKMGPVDLRHVFESTLRIGWNEIRHRARLVKDFDAGGVHVTGNAARLGQVLLNLVLNAAQAIPEGRAAANEIRLATRRDGETVVIEISDTGVGMPPEVQRRLFEPFFTTKPPGAGTGLGLVICSRIISKHGGAIEVESAPGRGTTFRIRLPAAQPGAVASEAGRITPPRAARRGRVLLIDDEIALGQVVNRALAKEHEVVVTTRAVAALEWLRAGERFDLILCDLMMPEMTGAEFFTRLEKDDPAQAERVVFLTGGAFTTAARDFLERSGRARLDKPFELAQLRAFVNARIG